MCTATAPQLCCYRLCLLGHGSSLPDHVLLTAIVNPRRAGKGEKTRGLRYRSLEGAADGEVRKVWKVLACGANKGVTSPNSYMLSCQWLMQGQSRGVCGMSEARVGGEGLVQLSMRAGACLR
jgi:hypothetical protein